MTAQIRSAHLTAVPQQGQGTADRRYDERTHELLSRLKEGEPAPGPAEREELIGRIVDLHEPVVRRIARKYRDRGEPEEDLRQVISVGLVQAVRDFDPSYGREFISYALPMMTGELKRYFRDCTWAVRVPRRLQEKRTELNRMSVAFMQEHGRGPTPGEIGRELGLDEQEARELVQASSAYSALSLDVPLTAEEEVRTLADTLGEEDTALEGAADRTSLALALATLPPRERRIVLMRFHGNRTQTQIADAVGLSQMHVSRLLTASIAHLRREMEGECGAWTAGGG